MHQDLEKTEISGENEVVMTPEDIVAEARELSEQEAKMEEIIKTLDKPARKKWQVKLRQIRQQHSTITRNRWAAKAEEMVQKNIVLRTHMAQYREDIVPFGQDEIGAKELRLAFKRYHKACAPERFSRAWWLHMCVERPLNGVGFLVGGTIQVAKKAIFVLGAVVLGMAGKEYIESPAQVKNHLKDMAGMSVSGAERVSGQAEKQPAVIGGMAETVKQVKAFAADSCKEAEMRRLAGEERAQKNNVTQSAEFDKLKETLKVRAQQESSTSSLPTTVAGQKSSLRKAQERHK